VATAVLIAGMACGNEAPTGSPQTARAGSSNASARGDKPKRRTQPVVLRKLTLKALHMTCAESCPASARVALRKLPSVYQVAVDLDRDAVYISYNGNAGEPKQAAEPMLAALRSIGFDPWFKAEGWPDDVADRAATVVDE
jgi:hypothetical protein